MRSKDILFIRTNENIWVGKQASKHGGFFDRVAAICCHLPITMKTFGLEKSE
jgi:hypothetical protein